MKNKLIVANWKMNGDFAKIEEWTKTFLDKASKKLGVFENVVPVLCPPAIMIDEASASILDYALTKATKDLPEEKDITEDDMENSEIGDVIEKYGVLNVGAQDCHSEKSGAYTGDVSAKMLCEVGCDYVIVGHSERRKGHYEANETVSNKVETVVENDMTPILCVGESKEVRDSSKHLNFVKKQLISCVPDDLAIEHLVIAYEPIWAIGTGAVPTVDEIKEVVTSIKGICDENFSGNIKNYTILYGGSVGVKNADEILGVDGLDGLLVGKVSLEANDFFEICQKAVR